MRLIDADALNKNLNEHKIPFNSDINAAIIFAPTIEAEPIRHGEWVRKEDEYAYWYECSECGDYPLYEHDVRVFSRYCPNCGAKMNSAEIDDIFTRPMILNEEESARLLKFLDKGET